mmetsp:Transcript_14/g.36  ORF Transcript_14/g.36 Transcript_14/m.36 type:complete len:260 (-) Transcript_14:247-1026(-)
MDADRSAAKKPNISVPSGSRRAGAADAVLRGGGLFRSSVVLEDAFEDVAGRGALREEVEELSVGSGEVEDDRVVDEVVVVVVFGVVVGDRGVDAVRLGGFLHLVGRADQKRDARVEIGRKGAQLLERVAPRVERHEERHDVGRARGCFGLLSAVLVEEREDFLDLDELGGTYVGAAREAKVEQREAAAERRVGDGLGRARVDEGPRAAERGRAVGLLRRRRLTLAALLLEVVVEDDAPRRDAEQRERAPPHRRAAHGPR